MTIHIEDLPPGSKLVRIYSEDNSFENRDAFDVSLIIVFRDSEIEIKGVDKKLKASQRRELEKVLTDLYHMPIWSERHGKKIYYVTNA